MILKDERAREFTSGLLSAIFSIILTYPATKLIYRQILEKSSARDSFKVMRTEGMRYAFRGLRPPLLQRSTEIALMFGVYKAAQIALHPLNLSTYEEKVASSSISGLVQTILCPFERTQMLLIDPKYHGKFKNMWHLWGFLVRHHNMKEFFRGGTAILTRNICHNTFFFIVKDEMYKHAKPQNNAQVGVQNFLIGSVVGLLMTTFFYPLKVVKANMQGELGTKYRSILETAVEIYKHHRRGVRNFYQGALVNIARSMVSWGLTNLSYEFIRMKLQIWYS